MLTICPTPIGNLEDVTARQRRALSDADVIVCEDTRVTGKLLELLGIPRPDGKPQLISYHEHNERERVGELINRLDQGQSLTLVSDAGTPCLADPGYRLVAAARDAGIAVTALPGPFAGALALSAAGLPTDTFVFGGFLPSKGAQRRKRLEELLGPSTLVLYEAPGRILDLLSELSGHEASQRRVCLGRELTKRHEEWLRGTAGELHDELSSRDRVRGEFVVVVEGLPKAEHPGVEPATLVAWMLEEGLSPKQIKALGAKITGETRSTIYQIMGELKGD